MSLTGTDRGANGNNTAATTLVISPTTNFTANSFGVLCVAVDNAGSGGGTAISPASITDSVGNIWTLRQSAIYDPAGVSAGVEVAMYTAQVTRLTTSDNITITWLAGTSPTAKAWTLCEWTAAAGKMVWYITGGVGTGAGTASPTVTTGSITSGDGIVGCGGVESADTWAGDADTTNGNWSTHQHTGFGTGTSGMSITSQRKIVTGSATQTYNPTLTSADCILAWIQLREINAPLGAFLNLF